jgi:proline iminopeptidase
MTAITPGDHYFEADDVRFHYRARGSGPVFVAQSVGWGPSAAYLWNLLKPLEARFTVVYFEPRGNGLSGKPSDESKMNSNVMAHDLEHLRKELGLEVFPALFGHSNGGCIATAYAILYPDRVENLVLMDPEINGDAPTDNFAKFAENRKDDPVYGPALQALISASTNPLQIDEEFLELLHKILPYYFTDTSKVEVLANSMEVDKIPLSVWAFLRQAKLDRESPFNHLAEAHKIKARTLILQGSDDAFCSLQRSTELRERIPSSELVVFECGHFPVIEKPDEFWKVVNAFFGGPRRE